MIDLVIDVLMIAETVEEDVLMILETETKKEIDALMMTNQEEGARRTLVQIFRVLIDQDALEENKILQKNLEFYSRPFSK